MPGGVGFAGAFSVDLALLLVPMTACALMGVRLGIRHPLLLLICGFAGAGLLGFAVFWAYVPSSGFGRVCGVAATAGCVLLLADGCRGRFEGWRRLRPFGPVSALFAASGLFDLALGYLHGGFAAQADVAVNRYRLGLPGDGVIPLVFAQQLHSGTRPLPVYLMSNWQSSDRPPLQTGYDLLQQSVLGSWRFDDYQILGTLLQATWVFGLWALLHAAGKPRRAVPVCLAAVLFNGFVIQNSFFTWPKLLAATGVLLAAAVLLTPQLHGLRGSRTAGALAGLSLGTAMLGHPGTLFALIGIVGGIAALWRVRRLRPAGWYPPSWRFTAASAAGFLVAYAPWPAYQRFVDPPGNLLTEVNMADAPGPEPGRSTLRVIFDAYREAGAHQVIADKASNYTFPFQHTLGYLRELVALPYHLLAGQPAAAQNSANNIVTWQFFCLGPILGLTGWGLVLLAGRAVRGLVARRPLTRLQPELVWLLCLAITLAVWPLMLFGPVATSAHQGTYFVEPVLIAVGVLAFWSLRPVWAIAVTAVSGAMTLWVYIGFTPEGPVPGSGNTDPVSAGTVALLVVSIAACLACLWRVGADQPSGFGDVPAAGSADSADSADSAGSAQSGRCRQVPVFGGRPRAAVVPPLQGDRRQQVYGADQQEERARRQPQQDGVVRAFRGGDQRRAGYEESHGQQEAYPR